MRVLLSGARGQLGRHLHPMLDELGDLVAVDVAECDLTDRDETLKLLDGVKPELIVNPAAMTAVDLAEDEPTLADHLNHALPSQLAAWCADHNARLIHYSTDYVFGGAQSRPWREDDPQSPQSVYGRTKQAGEHAIMQSGAGALILRTAWLYSALPGNFLTAILNKAARGESLQVVNDQFGSPTWAQSLAEATMHLIRGDLIPKDHTKPLHCVNRGAVSWYEFAKQAVNQAHTMGLLDSEVEILPVKSDQWPQKATRPSYSVLDTQKYTELTGIPMPSYEEALSDCLSQWSPSS